MTTNKSKAYLYDSAGFLRAGQESRAVLVSGRGDMDTETG